ncbi:SDR family NAD(P)-dependent oxidoreductase [Paenibacillus qinlingensis]|uniref:NAD(P)-dependent dehydrogenase (Short-subunit alcohol dehydrogenase family) n=1 Tax=Paenibacillus qinlingensis TaxID=1837343 RepID=A0ABU1NYZ1_9BACL|nr:SDR family NAD(P)-dependent oxidoreductase [Paenibacillus qinlingensis]MDR6552524.1 NAD(P)-dependent dehydrogenase (short-subunit alcohol dehydrogenase family) [Paenibacillus qinlingensis]
MPEYAFVTGAERGIGAALVKQLLLHGFTVIAGTFLKEYEDLAVLKQTYPDRLYQIDLDVSSEESVRNASNFVAGITDSLDILINNAAIIGNKTATITDVIDFEGIQQVYNVNALGALRMSNQLIEPLMNSRHKLIVNISSEAGSIGQCHRTGWFAYAMSKSALNMQSALIHNQIKVEGGQVLILHPGAVQGRLSGTLNAKSPLTPDDSAVNMIKLIMDHASYRDQHPAYLDYLGQPQLW